MLNLRIPEKEKHALRILAAKRNLNLTEFVLKVLRDHTSVKQVADSLASDSPDKYQNDTHENEPEEPIHAAR